MSEVKDGLPGSAAPTTLPNLSDSALEWPEEELAKDSLVAWPEPSAVGSLANHISAAVDAGLQATVVG